MGKNKWWCLFGVHEYAVIDKGPYSMKTDFKVRQGEWYISRCECCGKLKYKALHA